MPKVVINSCFGGFGLSVAAIDLYHEKKELVYRENGKDYDKFDFEEDYIERDDPVLVQVVEELGKKANDSCSSLRIVDVPDDVKWHIEDYDGMEHVAEDHRTWH